jgi:hypothetical protein
VKLDVLERSKRVVKSSLEIVKEMVKEGEDGKRGRIRNK